MLFNMSLIFLKVAIFFIYITSQTGIFGVIHMTIIIKDNSFCILFNLRSVDNSLKFYVEDSLSLETLLLNREDGSSRLVG